MKLYDGASYSVHVDSEDRIFAGTLFGVIQSINSGENWQIIFDEQMPRTFPVVLETDNNNKLLIGTYSYGLFELQLPTSLAQEKDLLSKYMLLQNYPNPFNRNTTISFSIAKRDFVTLKIFDSLGNEIAILENGLKNSGKYSIDFDASNLASGIYFYKLTTSQFSEKKMLLLR